MTLTAQPPTTDTAAAAVGYAAVVKIPLAVDAVGLVVGPSAPNC